MASSDGVPGWFTFWLGEHTQHRFVLPIDTLPGKLAYAPPPMPATVMATLHSLVLEESMDNTRSLTLSLGIQHLPCSVLPVPRRPLCCLTDQTLIGSGHLLYVLSLVGIIHPRSWTLQHAF